MIYYHGTDRYFKNLRLPDEDAYKDFGMGVYLAEKEIHARKTAYWKRGLERYVYKYSVNITEIKKNFNVKEFRGVSIEWLKYIIYCRTHFCRYDYDMIIGPTADANTQSIIQEFIKKHKNPTDEDYKILQKELKTGLFGTQVCIKSQEVLDIFNKSRIKETKV